MKKEGEKESAFLGPSRIRLLTLCDQSSFPFAYLLLPLQNGISKVSQHVSGSRCGMSCYSWEGLVMLFENLSALIFNCFDCDHLFTSSKGRARGCSL